MNTTLTLFVEELRAIGIPVSMVETLDAASALPHTDLSDRDHLRATLGATLVKNPRHYRAFDAAFDIFFGLRSTAPGGDASNGMSDDTEHDADADAGAVREEIVDALLSGDVDSLRQLIGLAVDRYAGMQPGRPVGGRYYTYRVMRRLDADELLLRLLAAIVSIDDESAIDDRVSRDEAQSLLDTLRSELEQEVTARLVEDRGVESVAASRRLPLLEDIDLMHATRLEIDEIERTVAPLARKLATRLSQRRRHGRKGRLDVRRTIRRSLGHGGVLLEPQFKPPRVAKPEIVVLCDVSGSMATFARFTLQLTYAISSELSKVRSFAFIDGLDEVTSYFGSDVEFADALIDMSSNASLVRRDGHSDYGRSFEEMWDKYRDVITPRSTVIITGDARNNYRPTGESYLARIAERARTTFWLNPEPVRYWDTGDSVMSRYTPHCDVVEQVRTLRQLEAFVEQAATPSPARQRVVA
ncbi:MAG: vWA domain-containing protein [Acidimicrobiia bacterium]